MLVVTNGWPHDGDSAFCVFIKRQVDSLREAGIRCDVLFIRGYRTPLAYVAAVLRFLVMNVGRPRYRLVHVHGGEAALAAIPYRRAPLVVSYLGDDILGTPDASGRIRFLFRVKRALLRRTALFAAATITKSKEMERALPARARPRNQVVPNGVETAVFAPADQSEARRELGWDERTPVVLFVAADLAVPRKRYRLAEAACAAAREVLPDLTLHTACGVDPVDVPTLMNAADCLLLTSSLEGSPNVVKEALMCNLPVVATDVGDVAERLDGVEPSVVCQDLPDSLAAALHHCLAPRRRSNGREVSQELSAERIACRVLTLYDQVGDPGKGVRAALDAEVADEPR